MTETGHVARHAALHEPRAGDGRARDRRAQPTSTRSARCSYEMLTGEPPFTGPTAQAIVAQVMTESRDRSPSQRHTFRRTSRRRCCTALEKLPADRLRDRGGVRGGARAPWRMRRARLATSDGRRRAAAVWALAAGGAVLVATVVAAFVLEHIITSLRRRSVPAGDIRRFRRSPRSLGADGRTIVFDAMQQRMVPSIYVIRPDYPEARPLGPRTTRICCGVLEE